MSLEPDGVLLDVSNSDLPVRDKTERVSHAYQHARVDVYNGRSGSEENLNFLCFC
jgi:hypothetical protein